MFVCKKGCFRCGVKIKRHLPSCQRLHLVHRIQLSLLTALLNNKKICVQHLIILLQLELQDIHCSVKLDDIVVCCVHDT